METASLEAECGEVTVETTSRKNADFCVYRPSATSVQLEVESYSAMRYHGE
jgi:hypothetical protein